MKHTPTPICGRPKAIDKSICTVIQFCIMKRFTIHLRSCITYNIKASQAKFLLLIVFELTICRNTAKYILFDKKMKNKNRQLVRVKILFNFVNNLNDVTEQMNILLDFFLELIRIKNMYLFVLQKSYIKSRVALFLFILASTKVSAIWHVDQDLSA